jgi:HAD superfamily hydrolase (TIGR01509 family)
MRVAILDIDGTLVDSNYQHAMAWWYAFGEHGIDLPLWKVHRHIGMGGDQMVKELAGETVERAKGDAIREAEGRHYSEMIGEVRPVDGAREAIADLSEAGWYVVLASSAKQEEVDHYVRLLDAENFLDGRTDSADVSATKPHPDLIEAALEDADAEPEGAVMVGDSLWDVRAAAGAQVPSIGVLTGGFGESELREAGAVDVIESVADLTDLLT